MRNSPKIQSHQWFPQSRVRIGRHGGHVTGWSAGHGLHNCPSRLNAIPVRAFPHTSYRMCCHTMSWQRLQIYNGLHQLWLVSLEIVGASKANIPYYDFADITCNTLQYILTYYCIEFTIRTVHSFVSLGIFPKIEFMFYRSKKTKKKKYFTDFTCFITTTCIKPFKSWHTHTKDTPRINVW